VNRASLGSRVSGGLWWDAREDRLILETPSPDPMREPLYVSVKPARAGQPILVEVNFRLPEIQSGRYWASGDLIFRFGNAETRIPINASTTVANMAILASSVDWHTVAMTTQLNTERLYINSVTVTPVR
jgi:hypothetical protein